MENTLLSYSVYGTVKNSPVNGLIRAYDHDLLQNELLGQSLINEDGSFEIKFASNDFSGKLFHLERQPDLYLSIYDENGKSIHTTQVYKNIKEENFRIDVELLQSTSPNELPAEEQIAVNTESLSLLHQKDFINAFRLLANPSLPVENQSTIVKVFPRILIDGFDKIELYDGLFRDLMLDRHTPMIPTDIMETFFRGRSTSELLTFQTEHISVTYDNMASNDVTTRYIDLPSQNSMFQVTDNSRQILIGEVKASPDQYNDIVHPIYVQKIGLAAEYAYANYKQLGFRDPVGASSERIIIISSPPPGPIPMQDERTLGALITSSTKPVIWITSRLDTDKDIFLSLVHEIFHVFQLQYHPASFGIRTGFRQMIIEGGAKFAEDCFMDSSNSYILFSDRQLFRRTSYQESEDYSYLFSTEEKTVSYAGALFWKYLTKLYSQLSYEDPFYGMDLQKKLLESIVPSYRGFAIEALRYFKTLLSPYGTFDSFVWNTSNENRELISRESIWGNYLIAKYTHTFIKSTSGNYDARFDLHEDNESFVGSNGVALLLENLVVKPIRQQILPAGQPFILEGRLKPYSVNYYELVPLAGVPIEDFYSRMLRFEFTTDSRTVLDRALVKVVVIRNPVQGDISLNDTLQDIYQTEEGQYIKFINLKNISRILLVVASRERSFNYKLKGTLDDCSDIMITRWNTKPGKEYEINPGSHGWSWLSPDIIVDNNDDLLDDGIVYSNLPEGQSNKLKIRIRNKGNAEVARIDLHVFVQKMTTFVDPAGWTLLSSASSASFPPSVTIPAPGEETWTTVDWIINGDGVTAEDWLVKVTITPSGGQENSDNKEAITHFSNVKPHTVSFPSRKTCKASLAGCGDLLFIPRDRIYTLSRKSNPISIQRNVFNFRPGRTFSEYILLDVEALGSMKAWEGEREPDPDAKGYFFPLNQEALPPGFNTENMVTVTQVIDGVAVGGVSYKIKGQNK